MCAKPLSVLIIEDSESDAGLVLRSLEKAGYAVTSERVETEAGLKTALSGRNWEIVIADYRLPKFNAEHALAIVREHDPDLPFLVVSGSIGEEVAVSMMRAGAHDYLMKGNLARLVPAVERELEQAQNRRARRVADRALRESDEQFRLLVDQSPYAITVIQDSTVVLINKTALTLMHAKSPADLLGHPMVEFIHPDGLAVTLARVQRMLQGEQGLYPIQDRYVRCDGVTIPVEVIAAPFTYAGKPAIQVLAQDITERIAAEEALRASEERFSKVFHASPIGISISSMPDGKFVDINPTLANIIGFSREEAIGRTTVELGIWVNPAQRDAYLTALREAGRVVNHPAQFRRKNGDVGTLSIWSDKIMLYGGQHLVSLIQDVTARQESEEALQASEERYRLLAENMSDTVWLMDMNLKILYISPSVVRQRGFTLEELNQLRLDQQMSAESLQRTTLLMAEVLSPDYLSKRDATAARRIEIEFSRKDGTMFWAECVFTLILDLNGKPTGILGSAREITERKHAEAVTQRQLRQFAALRNIDNAIRGSLDLRLTLSIILREAVAQLGVDAARILILHSQTKILEFAAGTGFRTSALQRAELRLGQGFAGQAALDQRTIHVPDLRIRKTDFLQLDNFTAEQFVTYCAVPLVTKGQVIGVMEVFSRSFTPLEERMGDWEEFMQTIADQAAIAVENTQLFVSLQQTNLDLTRSVDDVLDAWAHALDVREKESPGHTRRVAEEAVRLAKMLGLSDAELLGLRRGALLHDIGKMVIPDSILLKEGPLTPEESKILQRHPVYAYELLSASSALRAVLDIPYCHHEKWDGSGFPRGLPGERIPLPARIFAVVDAWDLMVGEKPGHTALPREKALAQLRNQSEVDFDPKIVAEYVQALKTERTL